MDKIHIITPVKDSIESTVVAIRAVLSSTIDAEFTYTQNVQQYVWFQTTFLKRKC